MVNWPAVVVGIVITLVLAFIGLFVPYLMFLAPVIGGLVAAYMAGGKYMDGVINGALAGGIGLLIALAIIIALFGAIAGAIVGSIGIGAAAGALVGAIVGLILGAILGLIGGLIGIAIKGQPTEEPAPTARKSPIIVFNLGNIRKCLCPTCPVQAESECAKEKTMKMQEMMESEEKMMPTYEDVPGIYCATGKATCTDIDPNKECQCPNCPIWAENDLEHGQPMGVFCRDGKAM